MKAENDMRIITLKQRTEALYIATLIHAIERLHIETNINIVPFLTPILVLPEFACFQHIAENTDDKFVIESYAIFKKLIDFYNIEITA